MHDQYGGKITKDLIELDPHIMNEYSEAPFELQNFIIEAIDRCTWYEYNNMLFIETDIAYILQLDFEGMERLYAFEDVVVHKIPDILHRYDLGGLGFYHA